MHKAYGESFHVLFVSFVYWKRFDMTILYKTNYIPYGRYFQYAGDSFLGASEVQ